MRRKGFYPVRPGELVEIDTVSIFADGLKRYLLTAIDLPTRFVVIGYEIGGALVCGPHRV